MIRKASINDVNGISDIVVRGWKTAYKGLIDDDFLNTVSTEEMNNKWRTYISSQNEDNRYYVYEKNDKILGIIRFGIPDDQKEEKYNAEIHVLYIDSNCKRQGIGTKLFEFAKDYFIKNNKRDLIIWCLKGNNQGINFYKKMGGRIVGERKAIVNNKEVEEIGFRFKL